MADSTFTVDRENLEVRSESVFKASPSKLFKAYTDPSQLPKWWGPARLITFVDKMDVKVGGVWRVIQTEPEGQEHAFSGVYKEVDEPNKLSYTFEYEPIPDHILVETVTFEEQTDGTTKLQSIAKYDNVDDLDGMVSMGMEKGATEGQERLAALVEKSDDADDTARENGFTITRTFNAPREKVWEALVTPEQFAQWFGLPDSTLTDVEMDVKEGGFWSATMHAPNQPDIPWKGEYAEVKEPRRLVIKFLNAENPDDPHSELVTAVLKDKDGKTKLTYTQSGYMVDEEYERAKDGTEIFLGRMAELVEEDA